MRRALIPLALSVVLVGLFWLLPAITSQAARPWHLLGSWMREWDEIEQKREVFQRANTTALWRFQAKSQVIRDLLADRLTLMEAAAWFDWINQAPGTIPFPVPPADQSIPPQEYACLQVIRWAGALLSQPETPSRPEMVEQLESELEHLLSQPDGLVLPEPPYLPGLQKAPECI
jgi:hypothetical protein